MPTELEELVGFLHHGNTQIRQIATENLVQYSKSDPSVFKLDQFTPVKDLKLLVKDYTPIAKHVLDILINISSDSDVLKILAEDDAFLETLLLRVTKAEEPNGNEFSMLLANLVKSPSLERLIELKRSPVTALSTSPQAITQLVELYNNGATGKYNKHTTYEYLAYLFADLVKYPSFQTYLTTPTSQSPLDPLTTFLPFTSHPSPVRRLGTATLLRNLTLTHPDPLYLLQPASSILAPILLPLCNTDQSGISPEEMEMLPEECQFLVPGEHTPETDTIILGLLLDTLYLVVARGGKEGMEIAKAKGTYPVVRELHLRVEDEGVRKACEKVVDVLMAGEADDKLAKEGHKGPIGPARVHGMEDGTRVVEEVEDENDEENEIVPIF